MLPDLVQTFVTVAVYRAAIAFARIGTAVILLPGFGETSVPPRLKIAFGVILSLCLVPALPIPAPPGQVTALALLLGMEVVIGAFIGLGARLLLAALHMLGAQIGLASGLSNALAPTTANTESATTLAALMTVAALAMIFATDLHHVMLSGLLRSYEVLPPGRILPGDLAQQVARLGSGAFYVAATMGAPFFLVAVLVNLAMGLANRVMPSMQVFFVAAPGLILAGLALMALSLPAILDHQIGTLSDWLTTLVR